MADDITIGVTDSSGVGLTIGESGAYTFTDSAYVPMRIVTDDYEGPYVVTPTGEQQTLATNDLHMTDDVTIEAAPLESKSVTVNAAGSSVVAPSTGYYGISAVDLTVPQGKISMQRPSMDNASGEVRSRANVTAGYVATGGTYTSSALILDKQAAATVSPTESEQIAVSQYRWTTGEIKVGAIPSDYVGSAIDQRDSSDLSASGDTVTCPAGYYAESASKAVSSGTEGTPTAEKSVSGHTATVTPSVTNTAGYISGGTRTGTAVTVGASELVSDTLSVTGGGTYNVTNYASASVPSGSATASATKSVSGNTATVTPKVTKTAGYVAAGTASGTAVTVTASELVSGTKSITANDTGIDVTDYASVDVAVPTGTPRTSADLSVSGATVTAPAGLYAESASATVQSGSTTMPSSASASGTIVGAVANKMNVQGTITATPQVSAGYVSAGTSGNTSVALQVTVPTLSATTYNPQATDRTIAAGTYTIGTQTIKGAPLQSKTVTTNGSVTPDTGYYGLSDVTVNVSGSTPNLQSKTKSYAPTETAQSETVSADTGYDGLSSVDISVGAISSTYVGSGITQRDSSDLSATNATVTVPSGYYASNASKSVSSGTARPASSISSSGATLSTGTNTIILSKSVSNVPDVTAGYISSGTSGSTDITLQATATLKGATTYHPSTSNQTISGSTYLTGTQTINAVTLANLTAENIKSGVTVKVGDTSDDDCVTSVTGTYTGGGGGSIQFDTKTASGGSTYPVSLQFTGMKGEPKAFVCRLNAQVSSSGSTTYYYIVDVSAFGTTTHGNCFRIGSTRRVDNITSGYSWSYSGTTLTITSSAASRSASPGAFHSGSYELLYAY